MTKLTIDDKEYDLETFTEEQHKILGVLNLGQNSVGLLNHMLQCVQAISSK